MSNELIKTITTNAITKTGNIVGFTLFSEILDIFNWIVSDAIIITGASSDTLINLTSVAISPVSSEMRILHQPPGQHHELLRQ